MNKVTLKHSKICRSLMSAVLLLCMGCLNYSCSEDYILDEEEPDWLGNSIYDYLKEQGNYTCLLSIIDDPDINYGLVLQKTGSKTLFIADDDAFAEFFRQNDWGVHSMSELTKSQKSILLNSAMINNVYYIRMLSAMQSTWSDSSDPTDGMCMRRETALNVQDSVPFEQPDAMPATAYWDKYREQGGMYLLKDNTSAPMIHFLQKFLDYNNIENDDITFIMGSEYATNDAIINDARVIEENIKCKNGALHKVEKVITPLKNMAQIVASHAETQKFSELLERFSAPYYANLKQGNDSVFVKRYLANRDKNGTHGGQVYAPADTLVSGYLKFDPGWNQYNAESSVLGQDMGVMFAPSDEAIEEYWNTGGLELKERYGTWDNMPDNVLEKMINNHLKNSFVSSVPSKFSEIPNDAQDPMGVEKKDIEKTYLGCNGIVYVTNKLYPPTSYVAVSSPALINSDTNMKIINWAIGKLEFDAYLLSMDSYYSFIIPTDDALLRYYNPVSWGQSKPEVYEFYYDESKKAVGAKVYEYDMETGEIFYTDRPLREVSPGSSDVLDKLEDILDYHIIIGDIENGNSYFRTKGNGTIKVSGTGQGMKLYGGYQLNHGQEITVEQIYDKTKEGNGKSYRIEEGVLEGPQKSVYKTMEELGSNPEDPFYEWFQLMKGSDTYESDDEWIFYVDKDFASVDQNVYYFNTYHYTVYVPTNEAVREAIADGLPTWDMIEAETDQEAKDSLVKVLQYCLRYHIQDNSVYIGGGSETNAYETSAPNAVTERFYKINVENDNNNITLTSKDEQGNTITQAHVVKEGGYYNLMTRDYSFNQKDIQKSTEIETSSFAVVHQIDKVLQYEKDQYKSKQ